jgi:hypothetical protein
MTRIEWFWTILAILMTIFITMLPSLAKSQTPSYRLYIYNMDSNNYYHVRIKNEDTRWSDAVNVEARSCAKMYRIEPGEYSIRTYRDGGMSGDYASFEVEDESVCIEITSVTGNLELCNKYYCSD